MSEATDEATNPAPAPTVWPTLRCTDARAAIAFLVTAFGFEETAVFADGDQVFHAQLTWPAGGGVMLGSAGDRGADDDWSRPPGTAGVYVVTDDVDALHARATAAGAKTLYGPRETDYGSREVAYADPEGNFWSFGTYRGEPRRG
ncbi:VOC family protein [Kineosporia sp. R_H_3]|uniref:VOC family protein n=1 Tax=Kineosporia sp. R_H_3 TaxID=1961848 RepID=UPI000B4B9096|nr:VOC family protein [Kineosporia sp. R_H_3]